jgi:hypothetical protein
MQVLNEQRRRTFVSSEGIGQRKGACGARVLKFCLDHLCSNYHHCYSTIIMALGGSSAVHIQSSTISSAPPVPSVFSFFFFCV